MTKKIIDKVCSIITETLLICSFIILVTIVFVEVCLRYLFNTSLIWPEELARYLFVWIVFIGVSVGIRQKFHIGIELFVRKLPKEVRKWVTMVQNGAICFFFMLLAYVGYKAIVVGMRRLALSLDLPMGYVYFAIPIGSILAVIAVVLGKS